MSARGQAVVETALGLLVFVTVLLFAIHLAEVASLGLRLGEAAAGALWDATAAPMHALPGDFSPRDRAIDASGPLATRRFRDFDGRSSADRTSTVTRVFTSAGALDVRCEPEATLRFEPPEVLSSVYEGGGGMRCTASAQVLPFTFARHLADLGNGALFAQEHRPVSAVLCAPGRGGGRCAAFATLLDDWGLAGPAESAEHPLGGPSSGPYFDSVARVVEANGGIQGAATLDHAQQTTFGPGPGLPVVWLSFVGEQRAFTDEVPGGEPTSRRDWPTTPGAGSPVEEYDRAYASRSGCFLGRACR